MIGRPAPRGSAGPRLGVRVKERNRAVSGCLSLTAARSYNKLRRPAGLLPSTVKAWSGHEGGPERAGDVLLPVGERVSP